MKRPPPDESGLAIDPAATVEILTRFIAAEVGRGGHRGVVLGLSGGLDSAVAAYLAARAVGPQATTCLLLPHGHLAPHALDDARRVVRRLGVEAETIDIAPLVRGFLEVSGEVDRLRLGNAMARCRMLLLYDRSAVRGSLVLGTSNKSELLLGYGTIHGDLAHALNPLGDLYKTQVRALADYLRVPASIRRRAPSADLWPQQTDERELGFRYADVDRLLELLIDARASRRTAISAGFPREFVDRVLRRVVRTQFKRRPPLIAKISTRTIGWDFRYPRDWLS
ncbi:MAG TPA: NAD+ synthase [Candidatus Polarisedimenticolaceae bacterium]|nr:NAD+ synthase [Candidatus Polarisedimenticolaceae bacterium]